MISDSDEIKLRADVALRLAESFVKASESYGRGRVVEAIRCANNIVDNAIKKSSNLPEDK